MDWIQGKTKISNPSFLLSSHSGGVSTLDEALKNPATAKKIKGVIVADPNPLTGTSPKYEEWRKNNPKLVMICKSKNVSNGTSRPACERIQKTGGKYQALNTGDHYRVGALTIGSGVDEILGSGQSTLTSGGATSAK
jgi:hypothetical protein